MPIHTTLSDLCCCCCCGRGSGIANGGSQRRRHAWEFPSSAAESLRLGHLLDDKGSFEQLNQDDVSDEDEETSHPITSSSTAT